MNLSVHIFNRTQLTNVGGGEAYYLVARFVELAEGQKANIVIIPN